MSSERIDYSSVQRYEDYIEQLNVLNGIECQNIVDDLNSKVSYLPRVTSIASGVGHCIYEAKLKEMLGVKEVVSSSFPGKGRLVHQLLALASLNVFGRNSPPNKDLEKYFEELVQELHSSGVGFTRDEKTIREAIKTAANLFRSLLTVKNDLFRVVGINADNVRPVVEQQLYDYELHMLGVPDLVLEDIKNRKAVVVEWKSYGLNENSTKRKSVTNYEKAQVIAYAMLEARRLGYKITVESSDEPSVYEAVSGKLTEKGIDDVRVLPVVIRPDLDVNKRLTIPPHPLLSNRGDVRENYRKFRETMGEIYVTAHYLTYLVTNLRLYGYGKEDLEDCSITRNGQKRIAILWPPPRPVPRGNPSNQTKSRLCSICNVKDECAFYIAERHVNYFQKMMWALRYATLSEKEKLLWPFRAVYELSRKHPSRDYVVSRIKKGDGIVWDVSTVRFARDVPRNRFLVTFGNTKKERFSFKVDVVEQLYYDKDNSVLVGVRRLRDYEFDKASGRINRPYVLEESTPIILYANDGASTIPLSINMTGSIEDVKFVRDDNGNEVVKYYIHIPSPALAFQEAILLKYLELYPEIFRDVILVQVGVDLTHIDLITIDALQRVIGRRIEILQELEKKNKLNESILKEKKKLEEYYNILEKEKNRLDFESEFGSDLVSENVLRFLSLG